LSRKEDGPREVAATWADLNDAQRRTLIEALGVMRGRAVSFESLAKYAADFEDWCREQDRIDAAMEKYEQREKARTKKRTKGGK
jgi:hypothetical protein